MQILNAPFWTAIFMLGASVTCYSQTLGEALNATNLVWTTGGDSPWLAQTNVTADGVAAASSGDLALGKANWIETTVSGPSSVTFSWKTSSSAYAQLSFVVGSIVQATNSGETDWQRRNFFIPGYQVNLRWAYAQNGTVNTSQNRAWLDQVSFSDPVLPAFDSPPTNQTVLAGDLASFSALVSGTEPFKFQWRLNGTNLSGATKASLSLTNAQVRNAGSYCLVVTNPVGVVTSQVATLTVLVSPPVITLQPVSQGAAIGATVTLVARAKGSEPLGWQWFFNNGAVSGGVLSNLTVTSISPLKFGDYRAVVTNAYGSTTSSVAMLSFSPVICWGDNDYGQTNVPPSATNVVAIAAGDNHCLALRTDRTVTAWGGSSWDRAQGPYSPVAVPPDASNIIGIAAGSIHCLGVREDGTVALWGYVLGGNQVMPPESTNVALQALGPGAGHVLALRNDGTILDWGRSSQLLTNIPAAATNVVSVAAGAAHCLALRGDGTLIAWGDNNYGQLNIPGAASNVVAVSTGWYHNLVLRADGSLVQWGYYPAPRSPGSVPSAATNIVAFACGGYHSLALRADGKLFTWGGNDYGQTSAPHWATNLAAVAGGSYESLALVAEGPPILNTPLLNRSVAAGKTAYFRATAVGAWPLRYQWQLNGTNLAGATNAVLAVANAQATQAGAYSVVVSNALGFALSPEAYLTVLPGGPVMEPGALDVANGRFSFTAKGAPGFTWKVQASENLMDWSEVGTLTNATGTMSFTDPSAVLNRRFYRLEWAP